MAETVYYTIVEALNKIRKDIQIWVANNLRSMRATLVGLIDNKVEKIEGKGLSTEDFTTAEKTKLSEIEAKANNYTLNAEKIETALGYSPVGPDYNHAGHLITPLGVSLLPGSETDIGGQIDFHFNNAESATAKIIEQQQGYITLDAVNGIILTGGIGTELPDPGIEGRIFLKKVITE